jgi:hypothetical protein
MQSPILIERIDPPSISSFYEEYVHKSKPVVIKGLAEDWPAMQKWGLGYFAQNFATVDAGVIKIKGVECDLNTYQGSKLGNEPIGKTIDLIAKGVLDGGAVIAAPVDDFPAELQLDYRAPIYCKDGAFLRSRVFIGPPGTVTSLHQDLPENLYVMVKGKKKITLFPPQSPVYPNSRFSKLPNHAQVDVNKPDYDAFPKFAYAQPYVVELTAGETLFIPSFWWHHLQNGETSMAVNFWWSYGWKLPIAWAAAMYKKWRAI